jgi:hypothetical protein
MLLIEDPCARLSRSLAICWMNGAAEAGCCCDPHSMRFCTAQQHRPLMLALDSALPRGQLSLCQPVLLLRRLPRLLRGAHTTRQLESLSALLLSAQLRRGSRLLGRIRMSTLEQARQHVLIVWQQRSHLHAAAWQTPIGDDFLAVVVRGG